MDLFWLINFSISLILYCMFSYILMIPILIHYGYDDFLNTFAFGNEKWLQWVFILSPIFLPICILHKIYIAIKEMIWNK